MPEGVLVYVRTSDENDALAYVDTKGESITESQLEILRIAECRPNTPAMPRHDLHHGLVQAGVKNIAKEEKRRSARKAVERPRPDVRASQAV